MDESRPCMDPTGEWHAALVAYLYDEAEPAERERVEAHLAACPRCADELDELTAVRGTLAAWAPPEPEPGFRIVGEPEGQRHWWQRVVEPAWGLAAAAVLVLVVGAMVAGVELRYDAQGFAFRVGRAISDTAPLPDPIERRASAPWRSDLAELESVLRRDLAPPTAAVRPVETDGDRDEIVGRVQGLIAESERRQQQEIALWFTEFAQEFDLQRRADQQRIQRELGALEGYTNYLVRTSGQVGAGGR